MSPQWRKGQMIGKYRLRKCIGHGGFAEVYHAWDTVQRIDVALKVPFEDDVDELEHEVHVASRLCHPNLLPVLNADVIHELDDLLIVAHPLGLGSLDERMADLDLWTAMQITQQVLAGLDHAHREGVIHCDVKPENIICFEGDLVRLGDFGLHKRGTGTCKTSEPGGTLGYMAPELAMGSPSPRSDLFSVAIVAWEMLTGHPPQWPFSWPPPHSEHVPEPLWDWFRKALQPAAEHRFPTADEMRKSLISPASAANERL